MVRNPYEDGTPEYLIKNVMIAIQINYITLALTQQKFKKQFNHAVESLVLLVLYFIYAA